MEALNEIKSWLRQAGTARVSGAQKAGATANLVLFYGADSGKRLLAAKDLATDAGKELLVVDLKQVISNYIGETEKNLRHLFEKAAESDAVLFFDEADALFGKRTGVRDSHDRYANQEISYLMKEMVAHTGLVILATAKKGAVDAAVLRRMRYVVAFD